MKVTEGLVELKLLSKRIASATANLTAITFKVGGVMASNEKDPAKFDALAVSGLQSVKDLIERRQGIKSALVLSNATTKVTVAGVEMTVASAIERKESIEFERSVLSNLVTQYNQATRNVEAHTTQIQREVDEQVKAMGSVTPEFIVDTRNNLLEQRKVLLHDPLGLLAKIEEMRKSIDDFEAEVDVKLSISNATAVLDGI